MNAWMEKYRIHHLGLPHSIVAMAQSPKPLSQADRQEIAAVYHDARHKCTVLRTFLQSESRTPSPMLDYLQQAEVIAILRIRVCRSLSAAWRRLPLELWDRIFGHYLDNVRERSPDKTFDEINKIATLAPATLCLVSKFWSAVTHAAPSIWKEVTLPTVKPPWDGASIPLLPRGQIENILGRLNRVAATPRSSSLTISVEFTPRRNYRSGGYDEYREMDTDEEERDAYGTPVADAAAKALERKARRQRRVDGGLPIDVLLQSHTLTSSLERVFISIPSNFRRHPGIHIGRLKFASATSLVIIGPDVYPWDADSSLSFPAVKKAVLIGTFGYPFKAIPTYIPWSQLTHLALGDNTSRQEVNLVLGLCTRLVRGLFWMGKDSQHIPTPDAPSTLRYLTDLALVNQEIQINFNPGQPVPFPDLTFPALTRLDLFGSGTSLSRFSHLTTLRAVGANFAPLHSQGLESILDICPLLVELMAAIGIGDLLFPGSLVFDPDRPRGFSLRVIGLICHSGIIGNWKGDVQLSIDSVHNIATSRMPNETSPEMTRPATLERLTIRYVPPIQRQYYGVIRYSNGRVLADFPNDDTPTDVGRARALMQPLVAKGLHFSIGTSSNAIEDAWPRLDRSRNIKHWDFGMDKILEDAWESAMAIEPSSTPGQV